MLTAAKGKAAANALELKSMLNRTRVKVPQSLIEHYPGHLREIALKEE
jgi:hypothetical protein